MQFSTKFETLYPGKTHYNMKEAWTLEVILAINLTLSSPNKKFVLSRSFLNF